MKNETYNTIRQMLIKNKLPIKEYENKIISNFKYKRFNIDFTVSINDEYNILSLNFLFPFTVFDRYIIDFAVALCKINNNLNGLGTFKLNIYDKSLCFYAAAVINDHCHISAYESEQILLNSINTISEYIERLYKLARGKMTFEEFDMVKSN